MIKSYLILAIKVFRRRRFFTFISLFAISLTLAVLMVAIALLDHLFGPMPPETKLDRTLGVYAMRMSGDNRSVESEPGYGFLDHYVRTIPGAEFVSIYSEARQIPIDLNDQRQSLWRKYTDGAYWKVLDFTFIEGAAFSSDDDRNANRVAVINKSTATRFFGHESALGHEIAVGGQNFRVCGVVADVPTLRFTPFADVWVPIGTIPGDTYRRQLMGGFQALILARDPSDLPRIKADFAAQLAKVDFTGIGDYSRMMGAPETYFESLSREMFSSGMEDSHPGALLTLIVSLMILFMLLPAVNLVNINVSRILERSSEIGVRKAFGASSAALVGQFLVENVLLTLIGGVFALVIALIGLQLLSHSQLIPYATFHLNYRVFAYGLAAAVFFGLLSGVYPAWRMSRFLPVDALRGRIQ